MSDLARLFQEASARHGVPVEYLSRTAQIESSMNPNARNPRSSAGGLFQFIDSTARQYGLQNRFDPAQATDAAARLAADNARILRGAIGRDPTPAELYLAHQQGASGASKLLANPNAPAASLVGEAAIRLNGGAPAMTAQQFASKWLSKFGGGGMQMPAAVAGGPAPAAMQPGRALPMFAQGVTPAAAAPQVNPQAAAAPLIAQMFMQQQAQQDQQAEEQRRDEEAAARARRRALFSGPSPFG